MQITQLDLSEKTPNKGLIFSQNTSTPPQLQPGLVVSKPFLALAAACVLTLSGCASMGGSSADASADEDYRLNSGTLARTLETPPDLFAPSQNAEGLQQFIKEVAAGKEYQFVPTYRAQSVSVKSNLSERWLEIRTGDSQKVWEGVLEYLQSVGLKVSEARKDIGLIKTQFQLREQRVPLAATPGLTGVLNKLSPVLANGILDRFVVQVESDAAKGVVRVYFRHHMMVNAEFKQTALGEDMNGWQLRPYDPRMEAESLYEAMIFFGSKTETARQQLAATEQMMAVSKDADAEKRFTGVSFKAAVDESWRYVKAQVYRANWQVDTLNNEQYVMVIKVPEQVQDDTSTLGKLAFWKTASDLAAERIPAKLVLRFTKMKAEAGADQTLVKVYAQQSNTPLTADKQRYIFEALGLLNP